MSMEEPRPSLARNLSIVAIAILATILSWIVVLTIWVLWMGFVDDPGESFWNYLASNVDDFPEVIAASCAGVLIGSLALVRLCRISKLDRNKPKTKDQRPKT